MRSPSLLYFILLTGRRAAGTTKIVAAIRTAGRRATEPARAAVVRPAEAAASVTTATPSTPEAAAPAAPHVHVDGDSSSGKAAVVVCCADADDSIADFD